MLKRFSRAIINTFFLIVLQVSCMTADQSSTNSIREEFPPRFSADTLGEEFPPRHNDFSEEFPPRLFGQQ